MRPRLTMGDKNRREKATTWQRVRATYWCQAAKDLPVDNRSFRHRWWDAGDVHPCLSAQQLSVIHGVVGDPPTRRECPTPRSLSWASAPECTGRSDIYRCTTRQYKTCNHNSRLQQTSSILQHKQTMTTQQIWRVSTSLISRLLMIIFYCTVS